MKNGEYLDLLFIYRFVSFESRANVACFGPLRWTLDSVRTQVNRQVGPFGQFTNLELDRTLIVLLDDCSCSGPPIYFLLTHPFPSVAFISRITFSFVQIKNKKNFLFCYELDFLFLFF